MSLTATEVSAELADFVARHPRLFVLTGAGCSTESGIPDYRSANGQWKRQKPIEFRPFMTDPHMRARYWARSLVGWRHFGKAEPNGAHRALAELEAAGRLGQIATQNVDGLHQAAGSQRVVDLHGRVDRVVCMTCRRTSSRASWQQRLADRNPHWTELNAPIAPDGDADLEGLDFTTFTVTDCPGCGGVVKPDVVFFGETVPRWRHRRSLQGLAASDAMLVVGSSLMVYSGYRYVKAAVAQAKPVAAVNLGRTRADDLLTLKVERPAGTVLPEAIAALARDLSEPGCSMGQPGSDKSREWDPYATVRGDRSRRRDYGGPVTSSAPPSSPATLSPARAEVADRVIAAMAGGEARLRADQATAVAALAEPGSRVLVVQATGWGKSAVYWAATAIRRAEQAGPTLVVSPLLSLMRDQVAAAARAGLTAATLNSSNVDVWGEIEASLRAGEIDVLLVSPERLANPGFGRRVLDGLAGRLGLLVIDEAHAVSDWGHDFRPDYRRVSDVLQRLNPETPVLATTATANARVTDDVAAQLGQTTLVLRGQLARASLQLSVIPRLAPIERYAWVVDQLPHLAGSGIVYTLTVADAERLAAAISAVHGTALPVAAYTGALDTDQRHRLEDALRANEVKALVATSALGMGYDKPDLGFVVHVGAPPSPVSYYQQVGRAGRAIDHAHAVLLPSDADAGVWEYFATATIPDPEQVRRLLEALESSDADEPATVPSLEALTGIRRGRVELMLKQLAVDGVVDRVERGWLHTGADWTFDAEHYDGIVAVRRREADIMRAYTHGDRCLMQLLQESLDDPHAAACGRCSVCASLPTDLRGQAEPGTVQAVTTILRGEQRVIEPRKMWPGGGYGSRGRIPADELAEEGRALVFADAPEWRDVVARAFRRDAGAPEEVKDGCVQVMASWRHRWTARPEVVVDLPAAGFALLTSDVADHLAAVGRLDRASISLTPGAWPDDVRELGSADEAAMWRDRLDLTSAVADCAGRPVLLVVDATSSLWPVTVAAAALRRAGATHVLPLVLHRRP